MDEYEIPEQLRYTEDHEWARADGDRVVVGITDYAQRELGDIVFVDLPEIGSTIDRGEAFGVVESVKAVSDLYAPASGEVIEVNADLRDRPEAVNEDCYGDGWLLVIVPDAPEEVERLMDACGYRKHLESAKA